MNPFVTLAIIFCAIACSSAHPATGEPAPHSFRIGVLNERQDRPDIALAMHTRLNAYLKNRLAKRGITVGDMVISSSVADMTQLFAARKVDGLIESLYASLSIQRDTGTLEPALLAWRRDQRQYHTVFLVRKDDRVRRLSDLAGRVIAFESARSTSAFALPLAVMQQSGLSVRPAKAGQTNSGVRYIFAGSEVNQAYWVLNKRADAAAFNDGDWNRLPDKVREKLRIVHRTEPILRALFSFNTATPEPVRAAVLEVLAEMHNDADGRQAMQDANEIRRFETLDAGDRASLAHWSNVLMNIRIEP